MKTSISVIFRVDSGVRLKKVWKGGCIVCKGGCRFKAAWVRGEEKAPETRQRQREAKNVDEVEVVPEVTAGSLRASRTVLIGPTQ